MIKSYKVIAEKKDYKKVSINEEYKSTEIICNQNDPLQGAILYQNERELLKAKKEELKEELNTLKMKKTMQMTNALIWGGLSVIAIGDFVNYLPSILSISNLWLGIFCTIAMSALSIILTGKTINTITKLKKTKINIINMQALLHNIDMMMTRTYDKITNKEKVKQKYFEQDKNNIHLTNVCVDKIDADLNKSIYDRWYGLNHDTCAKITKTTKKKTAMKEKMWDVFEPISLNTMDTKRFINNKVYTKNR